MRENDVDHACREPPGAISWRFFTEEMRETGGRVGFKIVTLDGQEAVFAHINFKTPERVGNMG